MKTKFGVLILTILLIALGLYTGYAILGAATYIATPAGSVSVIKVGPVKIISQCNDTIDNDADSRIDFPADPGCSNYADNSENSENNTNQTCGNGIVEPPEECDDGNINNGDGCDQYCHIENGTCTDTDGGQNIFVKGTVTWNNNQYTDGCTPGYNKVVENWCEGNNYNARAISCPINFICYDGACVYDNNGTNGTYQCSDHIDNDLDGLIDFQADPGCDSQIDDSEWDQNSTNSTYQCSDGIDNDFDYLIDFPADPGCYGITDNTELDNATYFQCSDGIDNDVDYKVDYPVDPGCTGYSDNSEYNEDNNTNQTYQCSDFIDNDNDTLIDFPADPGCYGPTDDNEWNNGTNESLGDGGGDEEILVLGKSLVIKGISIVPEKGEILAAGECNADYEGARIEIYKESFGSDELIVGGNIKIPCKGNIWKEPLSREMFGLEKTDTQKIYIRITTGKGVFQSGVSEVDPSTLPEQQSNSEGGQGGTPSCDCTTSVDVPSQCRDSTRIIYNSCMQREVCDYVMRTDNECIPGECTERRYTEGFGYGDPYKTNPKTRGFISWVDNGVCKPVEIVSGCYYDGTTTPCQPLSRWQSVKIMGRFLGRLLSD